MLNDLNIKLTEAKGNLLRKRKLEADLETIKSQINYEENRKQNLQNVLRKEFEDVEKLEGLTLTSLFQTILGNKEKQLEKERQEYLRAKLNFDECREGLDFLVNQQIKLRDELSKFKNTENEYHTILNKKEAILLYKQDLIAAKLFDLSEQLAEKNSKVKETYEASEAGKIVLHKLEMVLVSLRKAENWGTWDMFGGGIIATSIKHSRLDDARAGIHGVQQSMRIFERELKDVHIESNISIEIGEFLTFADYFFDGLITDWMVQDKIQTSINRVLHLQGYVYGTLQRLEENIFRFENDKKLIYEMRQNLIENAA